jgi:hypothetical protein
VVEFSRGAMILGHVTHCFFFYIPSVDALLNVFLGFLGMMHAELMELKEWNTLDGQFPYQKLSETIYVQHSDVLYSCRQF